MPVSIPRVHKPSEAIRVGDNRVCSIYKILRSRGIDHPKTHQTKWFNRETPRSWRLTQLTKNGQPFPDQIFSVDIFGKWSWRNADQ